MEFTSDVIIEIISTFGLAVLLVLYFVFIRDPKKDKFWQNRYDKLIDGYDHLKDNYIRLENDLRPESRIISDEQAINIADLGLDRDLYKLYYYMCEKIEGRRREGINFFIEDSIRITNIVWSKFKSPFPMVSQIGDLYGIYSSQEKSLEQKLEEIFNNDKLSNDDKKKLIWNKLIEDTKNMKKEFQEFIRKLREGREVVPFNMRK
jgi:hypothetical protein